LDYKDKKLICLVRLERNKISFSEKDKVEALQDEWDSLRPPKQIDQRIFYHFWENKSFDQIVELICKEFEANECYVTKCWWYSSIQEEFRKTAKRIGMNFKCLPCNEECFHEKYPKKLVFFGNSIKPKK
jgi:hypothetical protein